MVQIGRADGSGRTILFDPATGNLEIPGLLVASELRLVDTAHFEWVASDGRWRVVFTRIVSSGVTRRPQPALDCGFESQQALLDIFQNAASARIDAGGWIDYLHLIRLRGRWVILNVLWEIRQPAGERRR